MEKEIQTILTTILDRLELLDARLARIESAPHSSQSDNSSPRVSSVRRKSIKEFLIELAPADEVQKTLAIGCYLETQEGLASFNKADLEKGYRAAKESLPKNINDKVNMSIRNGHLMEAEEKKNSMKAWVVTRTGEQYVQDGFKKTTRGK